MVGVGYIKVPGGIERDCTGLIECRKNGRSSIAEISGGTRAGRTGTGHSADDAILIYHADVVVEEIGDKEAPIRSHGHAARNIEPRYRSRSAVARVAGNPVSCDHLEDSIWRNPHDDTIPAIDGI